MTTEIQYVTGDATDPIGGGPRMIAHVCNDVGGWGRGFVTALSARWPEPEASYRAWYRDSVDTSFDTGFRLGGVRYARLEPSPNGLVVANMIAQRGIRHRAGQPPAVDYDALRTCLRSVGGSAWADRESLHLPRIGVGLGGGSWDVISAIIEEEVCTLNVPVTVYDLAEPVVDLT